MPHMLVRTGYCTVQGLVRSHAAWQFLQLQDLYSTVTANARGRSVRGASWVQDGRSVVAGGVLGLSDIYVSIVLVSRVSINMPVCATCCQDLARDEFSTSQLKKKSGGRVCQTCLAASNMAATMAENPPPLADALAGAMAMAQEESGGKLMCCVKDIAGRGRVLTAARDFEAGEIVLRESPSLVWPMDRPDELFTVFLASTPEVKKAILEMELPPAENDLELIESTIERENVLKQRRDRANARGSLAAHLAEDYVGQPRVLELITALLDVADQHAHAFGEGKLALFPLASLSTHSCIPSCGHSTRVGNEMRFYAAKPLKAGDEVTLSFLPNLWSTKREDRRRSLLVQKRMFCRCERCSAADNLRGLRCVEAGCEGTAECGDGSSASWTCLTCKSTHPASKMAAQIATEAELAMRVSELEKAAAATDTTKDADTNGGGDTGAAASIAETLAAVRSTLSPTHHLCMRLLAITPTPPPSPAARANAAAYALAAMECSAAGCHSRACLRKGVTQHPAPPSLVGEGVTASLACASGGSKELIALSGVIASRYLPWAIRQFGVEDASVKRMQQVLALITPAAAAAGSGKKKKK